MTSNLGAKLITENRKLGFGEQDVNEDNKKIVMNELKREFKPEFINRIDEIIIFNKLTQKDISQIIDIMIINLQKRLNEKEIKIEVTDEFKNYIVANEIDLNYGARQSKRKLQEVVENRVAEEIINGSLRKRQKIIFDVKNGEIFTKIYSI